MEEIPNLKFEVIIMGSYEKALMLQLDEEEKRNDKKERKSNGWELTGDGKSIRRSGCYEEDRDEWN